MGANLTSGVASGGKRSGAKALVAHQHTLFSQFKKYF